MSAAKTVELGECFGGSLAKWMQLSEYMECISDIDREPLEEVAKATLKTPLRLTEEGKKMLYQGFVIAVRVRLCHIVEYAMMVKLLINLGKESKKFANLKDRVFDWSAPLLREKWPFALITNLVLNGCMTDKDVFDGFVEYFEKHPEISPGLSFMLLCGFAVCIDRTDHAFFMNCIEKLKTSLEDDVVNPIFLGFVENLETLRKDDWKAFWKPVYFVHEIHSFMFHDDVENFKKQLAGCKDLDTRQVLGFENIHRALDHQPTLLHVAAYFGAEKCFGYLIENGADVHLCDETGKNLVYFAIAGGKLPIIKQCEALKVDFAGAEEAAAEYHRHDILSWLRSKKPDENLYTIVHAATKFANIKILLSLLEEGVDVNVTNAQLWTPLHWAADYSNALMIEFFLSHKGVKVNAATDQGHTPLHLTVQKDDMKGTLLLLAHPDIDVNITDGEGSTPLHLAILNENMEMVNVLMQQHGIDLNYRNEDDEDYSTFAQNNCSEDFIALFNEKLSKTET